MNEPTDIIAKKHYHPKDPDYFKTYFQVNNKGLLIPCPRCNHCTSKVNLSKHMKRNICLKRFVAKITLEVADRLGLDPEGTDEQNRLPDHLASQIESSTFSGVFNLRSGRTKFH